MMARVLRAMARFEASIWGEAFGAFALFLGLWVFLWLPALFGIGGAR